MEEIVIKIEVPKSKERLKLALAKAAKEFVRQVELEELKKRLESKEEKELTEWSVQLGRKINEESWKKLLSKLPKEKREKLLK